MSEPALLFGPYVAPLVKDGDRLECALRGQEVIVGGCSDAPIPWPRAKKTGKHSLILCGDLIRAVRTESELAIAHWWSVSVVTVWKWRRALGIGRVTEGTSRLLLENGMSGCLQPEIAARGRETARCDYDARAKRAAAREGLPAHPNTAKALREAASRPKSEAWKRQFANRNRQRWAKNRGEDQEE